MSVPLFLVAPQSDLAFREAAIGMALIDLDGTFRAVNPALCKLVGRKESELVGDTWQHITHPEDVKAGEDGVRRALDGIDQTFRLTKRYVRPNGDCIWGLLSVTLLLDELGTPTSFFTQVVDITEQRRAADELADLAAIVESSHDGIASLSLDGKVLSWNRAAEVIYGYTAEEMLGRTLANLVPPGREDEPLGLTERVRRGEAVRNWETVRVRKDGTPIDVSLTVSPIRDANGEVLRTATIIRDITPQRRTAAKLDRTRAALEDALADARNSETRSRDFLCNAAHHLRNPAAGVQACAEALLRGTGPDGQERLLIEIARETSRMGRLVDRLLRIARLEQGEPLLLESCDLAAVARDEVERAQSLAPDLAISLAFGETRCNSMMRTVDREAVAEILRSLLENARRHAERQVDVVLAETCGPLTVSVTDDGPGLPAGSEAFAFEPFVSLDGKGGFGLGLAVSRALARAQGGNLTYEDRAFMLRLP